MQKTAVYSFINMVLYDPPTLFLEYSENLVAHFCLVIFSILNTSSSVDSNNRTLLCATSRFKNMDCFRKNICPNYRPIPNLNSHNFGAYTQCESTNHCEKSPTVWGGRKHAEENRSVS